MKRASAKLDPPTLVAGYDPLRDADECHWDAEAAQRVLDFFPACLTHTKGFNGGFNLEPWQRDIFATLFGWKRADKTRRYREALIAVPRKNGKTQLCAGISLYALSCDGERGPEVYCAAYSRDQATLLFDPAAQMVRSNQRMADNLVIHDSVKRIVDHRCGGFMRAIPAEAASSHGFNASAVIFDELHTQPNRDLYDVLKTSTVSRKQPIFISITTAGFDRHSICWEVWDYAKKVRDGIILDPYFLPVIYEMPEDADWTDRSVWRGVNPNFGVSVPSEYLEEAFNRAVSIPAYENTFRNLHLNQWVEQAVRWFSMEKWDAGAEDPDVPYGAECWCGLDLSTTTDISAFVMAFPKPDGGFAIECRFWVPAESSHERERRDRVPYSQWIRDGLITATPGASVDYDCIRRDLNELREKFNVRQIAIDRWNANQLAHQLQADQFEVGFFGQGFASMNSPAKHLESLIADGTLAHGGHPVLRWMASNVAVETDAAGNIKPSKKASTERIDGIVALCMALGVWGVDQQSATWNASEIGM
jgi:phage terminase large subunit-like protein